ncbi:MAG: type II toxin-antitoxin system HipA family toxin [Candidatus Marinimicrobia bacterium]|nr:type II toxin-antitoxin system HipA family toxin [Candidatus Neomarinimicrobiota bacterium]
MNNDARITLWGTDIGAVTWREDREVGVFQYMPEFIKSGIQVAPLQMPLSEFPYEFPSLARNTFKGLPGLLADSLPDKYGNAIIDAWLASQSRTAESFHPVERLCYVGSRGMGALEFKPATLGPPKSKREIEVERLVNLANQILDERKELNGIFSGIDDKNLINDILRVGTSAGGARAKAILAWNPKTNALRSGQINAGKDFEYWIMKFDGITSSHDKGISTPKGYGKIEYAYYLMAINSGIIMSKCRLHNEGGRSHFMTKRFDRTDNNDKIHMQSLGALAHFNYKQPASYSYEQAIQIMKRLELSKDDMEQQILRAFFNVIGRNCDDHVKNIAFLMDRRGQWKLSPAYDMTYAWDPSGVWTSRHQMSINQKRDDFKHGDLIALAESAGIKRAKADQLLNRVIDTFQKWPQFAEQAKVSNENIKKIQNALILNILPSIH